LEFPQFASFHGLPKAVAAITCALLACSCGGGSSSQLLPSTGVTVTISPSTASLAIGATQQFTEQVTGTSNIAVTWSVNGIPGGNSTIGTISSSGLYAAPTTVSSSDIAAITVTSLADDSKQASATVAVRLQVLSVAASPAQGMSASDALSLVRSAGARGQGIDLHWPDLEPSPGVYDFTEANQIDMIQVNGPFRIHVTLGVINTTVRQVPADLASATFDSGPMKTRFQTMLTALINQFGSKMDSIAIGNEVDVYLSAHPAEWPAYADFYGEAAALVRMLNPSIKVGVTTTFGGATDAQIGPLIEGLNAVSDMFMMNYYPLNSNFTPRDPSAVASDFTKVLAASHNKPILLQEVGFPTSTALGSSEQLQAEFVTNVFSAWIQAGDKIQFLSFFLLHDDTPQDCQQIANQFLISDPNFVYFFCSLGLRTSDGTDKLGWTTLKTQAQADGFVAQP
jgi:hypothetical protein